MEKPINLIISSNPEISNPESEIIQFPPKAETVTIFQLKGDKKFTLNLHGGSGNTRTWEQSFIAANLDKSIEIEENESMRIKLIGGTAEMVYSFKLGLSILPD